MRRLAAQILVLAAFLAFSAAPGRAAGEEPVRIALLPIVVHTLVDDQPLQEGLGSMLDARFSRRPDIDAVRVFGPAAATKNPGVAREFGRRAGVDYVVFGTLSHFGGSVSLDVRCVATHGTGGTRGTAGEDDRAIFVLEATLDDLIPRLDVLVEQIARHVGAAPAEAGDSTARHRLARTRR